MNVRDVPCPTCGAPAGSSCQTPHPSFLFGTNYQEPHTARLRAAESAEWERDRRAAEREARADGGVD